MANTRRNKPKDWASYYEDYYRRQREASGVTEKDQQEYRQYYLSQQDPEQLRKQMDEAKQGLISAEDLRNNTRTRLSQRNQALINYETAANQLRNYQSLGGSVEGVDDKYWQELEQQYAAALEQMQRDVAAVRATGVAGFGSLGAQTAQQADTVMRQAGITSGRGYAGKGLVDPQTGMPYQQVLEKAALRNSKQESEQDAENQRNQTSQTRNELDLVRKWQDALRTLPQDPDYDQQAADELGITSYTDRADLSAQIAARAEQLRAKANWSQRSADRSEERYRTAMAQLYQIDNPEESLEANYYLAMRDQAAKRGSWQDMLRYNSDYANQLYVDQKQADIQALRSDPTTGPIYQQAMEATRNANEAERLLQQANGEIYDYSGVGAKTELAIRDLANRYGITVGNGDDALVSFLERIRKEQQHTVDTNIARLQAQGYNPERLGQYIQQALNEQRMDEENAAARQYAEDSPVAASVGSSFQNLLSGGAYLATAPQAIRNMWNTATGNYDKYVPIDTNSEAFGYTQYVTSVRDEVAKNIEASGGSSWLYGVGMSMLDNMVQMAVGAAALGATGVIGATGMGVRATTQAAIQAASPVTLATMGMSAASQQLVSLTEQGVSSDKAFSLATIAGAIEIITEKIGIDKMVSNLGRKEASQILRMITQQMVAEGVEEGLADIGNLAADLLIRVEDADIMQMIDEGRRQGMTEQEALAYAGKNFGKQLMESIAAGALSGLGFGAMSSVGVAAEALNPANTGARIRSEGNEEVLGALATGLGVEYSQDMTDRQLGKTYRAVQKAGGQLQRELVQGMSMDTYAKEKGYDAKTTRALNRSWDAYHSVYGNEMSSREFAATWNSVKAAGEHGMSFTDAVSELGETTLSAYTLENAWNSGNRLYQQAKKAAKKAQTVTAQETAQQGKTSAMKLDSMAADLGAVSTEMAERASETAAKHAKSLMDERINVNGLSDQVVEELFSEADDNISTERRGALALARMITGISGNINQVVFVDSASTDAEGHIRLKDNGLWNPNTRTITIDINAGRQNVEQQMTFLTRTLSHEVTHSIKTLAPEQYAQLERFVLREMDKTVSEEKLIEAKIQEYADAGIELDKQGAIDELVAEACEQMLERTEVLNKLAQENKTLWEKIRDFVKNAIDKLRKLYKGMDANSPEGKMMKSSIDGLQAKWDAAFAASLEAKQETGTEATQDVSMTPAQEIQASLSRNEELTAVARTVNEAERHVPGKVMEKAARDRQVIADMMRENIEKYGNSYGLPPDIEGNTFLEDGAYGGSEENTTLCVRSMAHEAMMDAVSDLLGRPLTVQESIFVGQDLLARANIGLRQECTYCYVATDRKAYRAFLGKYLEQRDAVLKQYRNGETDIQKLYKKFRGKRKSTNDMWSRFYLWVASEKYRNGQTDISRDGELYQEYLAGWNLKDKNGKTTIPESRVWDTFHTWMQGIAQNGKLIQGHHLSNVANLIREDYDESLRPQIEDAMKYAQAASWAKKRMSYTAYNGHILKWAQERIDRLNSHYGLRMYSFSDFSPAFILENMQMFTDAAVRGLKVLAYTKELDFVRIFAKTGANINISCFGMEINGTIAENRIQGAAWEEAQKLRAEHPNVGITFVATNDALVEWALAQDWIDVVIPYHLVRTGKELAKQLGFEDYTKESSDKRIRGEFNKETDLSSIPPTEHDNDFGKYMAALEKNHLRPRFQRWIKNPNYMKLVNECRQPASQSKPVQPIFELDAAEKSLNSLIGQGGYYVPYGGSIEQQYAIADEIADKISAGEATKAARLAQEEWDAKHPRKTRTQRVQHQVNRDTSSTMDLLMGASMENLSKAEADHLLRYRDRVNEIRKNQQQIDELRGGEITADVNAKIRSLESANSMIYRKIAAAEKTDLMQRIAQRERTAGDVELQRADNRVADLEDEIDDLTQKIRDAKLAGQMAQGRKDAAALRRTVERYEARLESKKRELRVARESRDKKIAKMKESKAKDAEARKRSVLVHKIRGIANDLRQRTLRPTDGRYVPSYLTRAVIDVANLIDDAPGEGTKARARYDSMRDALRNLRDEYDKMERDSDPDYNYEYDREFSLLINELGDAIGGKSVSEMSYAEVEDVHDILRTIRYTLIDAVHQIGTLDRITNYETGDAIIREMQEVAPKKRLLGNIGTKTAGLAMSPMRNIRRMTGYREDSVLMELFDDLNTGVRRQNKFVMESNQMFDALREGKNRNTFASACNDVVDFGLVDVDGKPVKMTRMDAMQIILSYEREAANRDLIHMASNPVKIADPNLMRKGKVKEAISNGQMVSIGQQQVEMLQKKMTAWDNQFMDKARELFNTKAKDAINDTSRILKHRNIAFGKAYIPFHVDQNFVNREIEGLKIDSTIEGNGSLKSLQKGATQPLIITGLNHVLDDHINFVGKYSGLAIPIRNFNKAYNIKRVGSNLSAKSAIDTVWGEGGKTVIESAVKDLQRTRERPNDLLSRGLRAVQSGFVKSALLSNISVTIKQAASYSTAGLMLSQRALAPYQGTVAALFAAPNSKFARNLYAEIDAHTAQHWIRRQGMSTQELGDNAQRKGKLADFERKLPASLNPIQWIQNMDVATTGAIWLACKKEINLSRQYQENSSEYWDAVTELYDRVIEQTQPMYDSLHRPEVQKTTNELVRQLVMFRTQPLQNSGILYDAFGELTAAKKSGDKQWQKQASQNARRAAFSQVASLTVFATMTMVAGLLTHRVSRYRDDDEEITPMSVISTILGDMGQNAAGILLPLGGTELYDVIVNKIVGDSRYDTVSVPVASVINDYIEAVSKAIDGFEKQAEEDEPDWAAAWKNVYDLGKKTAELFGVPASNVEKILIGTYQNALDIRDGYFPALNNRVDRSNGVNYRRLYQALAEGDEAKFDEVYNELLQNLAEEDDAEKEIASGLSQEIKQAYLDGDLPEELATEYLVNYTITLSDSVERQHDKGTITDEEYLTMLRNEAYWIMKAWRTHDENADASDSRYADLRAAIDAGGDATAAREELLAHGVSEKAIDSEASNRVRELYKNGDIDRETAQEYLGEYANKTDGKDIYAWFVEADHWIETGEGGYGPYDPLYNAVLNDGDVDDVFDAMLDAGWTDSGIRQELRKRIKEWVIGTSSDGYTITTSEARDYLKRYGGVDDEDKLDGYVYWYNFMLQNPDYAEEFDKNEVLTYQEYGTGIPLNVFRDFLDQRAECDGDPDPDNPGHAIYGTVKRDYMAMIDSLPLSNEQKDQLYCIKYSEKYIYEAPWH